MEHRLHGHGGQGHGRERIDNFVRGDRAENFVKMSPLGPMVGDAARNQFASTKAESEKAS